MLRFESVTVVCCLIPVGSHNPDPRRQISCTIEAAFPPTKLIYILVVICQQKHSGRKDF
jgi:hypothetical protein